MLRSLLLCLLCIIHPHLINDVAQSAPITIGNVSQVIQIASLEIGQNRTVWDIAFSPDGRLLAVATSERSADRIGTVRLWDVASSKELVTPELNQLDAIAISFSPDGKQLAAAGRSGNIFLVNMETTKIDKTLSISNRLVNSISFSRDGKFLAIAENVKLSNISESSNQDAFALIEIESGKIVLSAASVGEDFNPGSGLAVAFSPDGKYVALGQGGNVVQVWDMETKEQLYFFKDGSIGIYSVDFSPESDLLVAGDGNGKVILWDVENGEKQGELEGGMQWDNDVRFNSDGSLLATTGKDGNIRFFDAKTQKEVSELKGHTDSLISLAFSPDGTLLASGGTDGTVRLWGIPAA